MLGQPCPELAVFIKSRPAPRVTPGWTEVYERVGHAVYDALSMGLDNVGKILDLGPRPGREEWNDRADELTETTTLRSVLGPDPEGWTKGRNWEDDAALIATGFGLLRLTGQIDPEGRRWLKDALKRQVNRGQGREYRRMLNDLKSYPTEQPD